MAKKSQASVEDLACSLEEAAAELRTKSATPAGAGVRGLNLSALLKLVEVLQKFAPLVIDLLKNQQPDETEE